MKNLPIQENVVDPISRMLDTEDLDAVAEWIQDPNWDDLKFLMQPEYDNIIFAYAYLHGLADAFDMTMLEVFTEWRSEQ